MVQLSILSSLALVAAVALPLANAAPAPQFGVAHTTGHATYYDPGVGNGACGQLYHDSDMVVALPAAFFNQYTPGSNPNNNPLCGRTMRVWYGGNGPTKSIDVKVVDKCPGCAGDNIDLSGSAFARLDNKDKGTINVSWMLI